MKKRLVVLLFILSGFISSINGEEKWSTQKEEGTKTVCYQDVSRIYCAGSSKGSETDLKNFLSAFLQFTVPDINKKDMKLHAGIVRLIRSSRLEQGKRILKGVYDYLSRESKNKGITIFFGDNVSSLKLLPSEIQKAEIESVNWPAHISASIEDVSCIPDDKVLLEVNIVNSMKKYFSLEPYDLEMRVFGGRNNMLSAGSLMSKTKIKGGEKESFKIEIPVTGDMVPGMRYTIRPFIRNIELKSEETPVICEEKK